MNELTLFDFSTATLGECEQVIERGLQTFVEVGSALLAIRERRLYRETHGTFEAYCRDRWGFDRTYAHRMVQASQVAEMLPMGNRPTSERQARELMPLRNDPDVMRDAWAETVERTNGRPTAAAVRDAVRERTRPSPPPPPPPPAEPTVNERPPTIEHTDIIDDTPVLSTEEQELQKQLTQGETVVVSYRRHTALMDWAHQHGHLVRVDRRTEWGNPFEMGKDGDRNTVIANYATHYLPHKPSLMSRLDELHGKALACWCAPEPCHADVLVALIYGEGA